MPPARYCTFPDCNRPHRALGLCVTHYAQHSRGAPLTPIAEPRRTCAECGAPHHAKGLCRSCYQRATYEARSTGQRGCSEPDCPNPHYAKGLCSKHYQRQARTGTPRHPRRLTLPPGWFKPAAKPDRDIPLPGVHVGLRTVVLDPPLPPWMLHSAHNLLTRHDALDLADTLGLTPEGTQP